MSGPAAVTEATFPPNVDPEIRVQILHVRDCALLERVLRRLRTSIARSGLDVSVETIEGTYPSPTVLINGAEVTGQPIGSEPCCRLDLPSEEQIVAALTNSSENGRRSGEEVT